MFFALLCACNSSGTSALYFDSGVEETLINQPEQQQQQPSSEPEPETPSDTATEEPPIVIGNHWLGSRIVTFETCGGELIELGTNSVQEQLRIEFELLCSSCTEFYEITVSPPTICSGQVSVATTIWRGVVLRSDNTLGIYNFSMQDQGTVVEEIAVATLHNESWFYTYESTFQSFLYTVDGLLSLPLLE
jgi:hypothetical protein